MRTSSLIFKNCGKSEIRSPIYFTTRWSAFQINRVGLAETLDLAMGFRKPKITQCHTKRFRYTISLKIIEAMVYIQYRDIQNKQYDE